MTLAAAVVIIKGGALWKFSRALLDLRLTNKSTEKGRIMFKDTESQLETINEIFAQAKSEDNWNLDEPMLYSFYFVDESVEKLEKLGLHLEKEGYDFIDIFELGEEETNKKSLKRPIFGTLLCIWVFTRTAMIKNEEFR